MVKRQTIADCIKNAEDQLQRLLDSGEKTQADLDAVSKSLDMDLFEFASFQNLKTVAVPRQLTLEDANHIYRLLGDIPSVFNRRPLAVKAVLTEVFHRLLTTQVSKAL